MITRAKLLGQTQRRYREVPLPNGDVARIRNLSEKEKSAFEASVLNSKGDFSMQRVETQRRRLIVRCLVDEAGQTILTDADLESIAEVDGEVTSVLYKACREHCGFEERDIEELVKNSAMIPAPSSPTESQASSGGSSTSTRGEKSSTQKS